jgi:hypothetical protein
MQFNYKVMMAFAYKWTKNVFIQPLHYCFKYEVAKANDDYVGADPSTYTLCYISHFNTNLNMFIEGNGPFAFRSLRGDFVLEHINAEIQKPRVNLKTLQ